MDRMNRPEESGKKRRSREDWTLGHDPSGSSKALQQLLEQQIEQNATAHMPENVREMEAVRIGVPNQVIENVGNVLDRSIMRRKRVEKEVVSKTLQDQDWTFDERIVAGQVLIVPDKLSLERWEVHREPEQDE